MSDFIITLICIVQDHKNCEATPSISLVCGMASSTSSSKDSKRRQAYRVLPTLTLLAASAATAVVFCDPRRYEWVDICLDYIHHKRNRYASNMFSNLGRVMRRVPK
eukprot:GHVQ01032709.1.p1 GENE.GHVQ01032709.1~~GHVQ01032709.1.p1  ORF type:complete len:106 (+),score=6.81 GHVQ01032709.1:97-414(+)